MAPKVRLLDVERQNVAFLHGAECHEQMHPRKTCRGGVMENHMRLPVKTGHMNDFRCVRSVDSRNEKSVKNICTQ